MVLGSEIRDPEKTYSGSRIQGSKRHRIPDPQHCCREVKGSVGGTPLPKAPLTTNPAESELIPGYFLSFKDDVKGLLHLSVSFMAIFIC